MLDALERAGALTCGRRIVFRYRIDEHLDLPNPQKSDTRRSCSTSIVANREHLRPLAGVRRHER
jgi:hypothetical protein